MELQTVVLIVLCIAVLCMWRKMQTMGIEGMADVDLNAVKEYNAFIDKLQKGNVSIPGNVTFTGRVTAKELAIDRDTNGPWMLKVKGTSLCLFYNGTSNKRYEFAYYSGLHLTGSDANAQNIKCKKITTSGNIDLGGSLVLKYPNGGTATIRATSGKGQKELVVQDKLFVYKNGHFNDQLYVKNKAHFNGQAVVKGHLDFYDRLRDEGSNSRYINRIQPHSESSGGKEMETGDP